MKTNKALILLIVVTLLLSTVSLGFSAIDYSQWDSNGGYPKDLAGTPLLNQARAFIDKGVISGYPDGLFHPEKTINRAEYAKMMATATNNTAGLATAATKNTFTDLKGYSWAKGYINLCHEAGLINGIGQSKYNPEGQVSYVEVVAIILRSKGVGDATVNRYGKWPNNYIKYAEILNVKGALIIRDWNAPATRGDVVQLLYRNLPKASVSPATLSVSSVPSPALSSGAVKFTAFAQGLGTHSYQWYYNNSIIPGATSATYETQTTTSVGAFHVQVKTTRPGYNDALQTSSKINVN